MSVGSIYADVAGLCKLASQDDIQEQDYSLTAGRYVGFEDVEEDVGNFSEKLECFRTSLDSLNQKSQALMEKISTALRELAV